MFNHSRPPEPRASRIPIPGRPELATELWMGGADALYGDPLHPEDMADAWVIDLAGELPLPHQRASACWLPRVFPDLEGEPPGYPRLTALARGVAACLSGAAVDPTWEHPAAPPARLYVLCQQGLNRSGLMTGLILRALGVPAAAAVATIRGRPGALNNAAYVRLLHAWEPERAP